MELFRSLDSELSAETRQLTRLSEVQRTHHHLLHDNGIALRAYAQCGPQTQADIDRHSASYQTIVARLPAGQPVGESSSFTRYAVCFRLPNIEESGAIAPTTLYSVHIGDRDRSVIMPNYGFEDNDVVLVSQMADELQTMHASGLFALDDSLTKLYGLPPESD